MKPRRLSLGLPLLAKELVEQSARRRTYVVRVLYACLLFATAFLSFYEIVWRAQSDPFGMIGRGKEVFEYIVVIQFCGIYLFMPAISCGVLTVEKERNSLGLLFLTRLGPTTILFEKLFSRVVPMLTFLLLSLPLMAFAYSLGGVSPTYFWSGVWVLALTMLQMSALGVLCSTFFRRTVGAFIGSYLLGLVLLFALPVIQELRLIDFTSRHVWDNRGFVSLVWSAIRVPALSLLEQFGVIGNDRDDILFVFFGPYLFLEHARSNTFPQVVLRSIPMMFSIFGFLVLARVFVVRRAFVPARQFVLGIFRAVDRLFTRLNDNRVTKGVVLVREQTALPGEHPIGWRETTKKSLGTVRYLFRVLVATELPVVAVCVIVAEGSSSPNDMVAVSLLLFFLWVIAVLLVTVKAASLVSSERSHQTLDVLLTTPLTARELVMQKYRGVRRLMLVLAVPFVTIFLFEASWRGSYSGVNHGYNAYAYGEFSPMLYLTASLLSLVIYLPMVAWLSFLLGMLIRTQGRAIIASLAVVIGWCVIPVVLLIALYDIVRGYFARSLIEDLLFFSPASIVPYNEFNAYHDLDIGPWTIVFLNFALYGSCLLAFRGACLRMADRLLGRAEDLQSEVRNGSRDELQLGA